MNAWLDELVTGSAIHEGMTIWHKGERCRVLYAWEWSVTDVESRQPRWDIVLENTARFTLRPGQSVLWTRRVMLDMDPPNKEADPQDAENFSEDSSSASSSPPRRRSALLRSYSMEKPVRLGGRRGRAKRRRQ